MTDKKTFDLLNFISENDNFSLKNGYDIAEEKFGWQIFLNSITELVNLSLVTKKDDGLTYTLTKLGVIRQSELRTEFESLERDKKGNAKNYIMSLNYPIGKLELFGLYLYLLS